MGILFWQYLENPFTKPHSWRLCILPNGVSYISWVLPKVFQFYRSKYLKGEWVFYGISEFSRILEYYSWETWWRDHQRSTQSSLNISWDYLLDATPSYREAERMDTDATMVYEVGYSLFSERLFCIGSWRLLEQVVTFSSCASSSCSRKYFIRENSNWYNFYNWGFPRILYQYEDSWSTQVFCCSYDSQVIPRYTVRLSSLYCVCRWSSSCGSSIHRRRNHERILGIFLSWGFSSISSGDRYYGSVVSWLI